MGSLCLVKNGFSFTCLVYGLSCVRATVVKRVRLDGFVFGVQRDYSKDSRDSTKKGQNQGVGSPKLSGVIAVVSVKLSQFKSSTFFAA